MRFYFQAMRYHSRWQRMNEICLSRVGYYHVDETNQFHLAEKDCFAKLKNRKEIQLPLDLNEGFNEERVDKPYQPASISYMMQWIRATKYDLKGVDVIMNTNLVLETLGRTLYSKFGWGFECFKLRGKVYIVQVTSPLSAKMEAVYLMRQIRSRIRDLDPTLFEAKPVVIHQDSLDQVNRSRYGYFFEKYLYTAMRDRSDDEGEDNDEKGVSEPADTECGKDHAKKDVEKDVEKDELEKDELERDELEKDELEKDVEKDVKKDIEKEVQQKIAMKKPQYYGMRFEDVMTTNNEGHNYSVITSKIAGYNILTRAEIDCSFNNEHVELKVTLDPRSEYEHFKFRRHKLRDIWLQSYYGGIEKVVFGMRSYEGFINRFFTYFVDEIPELCDQQWSAAEMTSFAEDVFGWVIRNTKEGFRTRVEYNEGDFIELTQTEYPEDIVPLWLENLSSKYIAMPHDINTEQSNFSGE